MSPLAKRSEVTTVPPKAHLWNCGDFSACFPNCLENLTSLESLEMSSCQGIVSIAGDLWSSNLKSLQKLKIQEFPDLVSVGGLGAIANINTVYIRDCPMLKELEQPLRRGNWWYVCHLVALQIMIQKNLKTHLNISCFHELDYISANFVNLGLLIISKCLLSTVIINVQHNNYCW
jgi:hypothetical protein